MRILTIFIKLKEVLLYFLIMFVLTNCSILDTSENTKLSEWFDKTENWFFPEADEDYYEDSYNLEQVDGELLDVRSVPLDPPPGSDLEIDFIEIARDENLSNTEEDFEIISTDSNIESVNSNLIEYDSIDYAIPRHILKMVRAMFRASDPPSSPDNQNIVDIENADSSDVKIAIIQFPINSIIPDDDAIDVIAEISQKLPGAKIKLVGHASSSGSETLQGKKYNMEISFQRADYIKNMLTKKGLLDQNIIVEGKGDLQPVMSSENNSDINRRVEVFVKQ